MGDFVAYPSRRRVALLVCGAAVFVATGLWMGGAFGSPPSSSRYPAGVVFWVGWLGTVFFGLAGVVWARRLFDTEAQLQIGRLGIRWTPWSDQTIPWSEIAAVTTWSYRRQKAIVLRLHDPDRFPGRGIAGLLSGGNRMLAGGDIFIMLTGTDRSFDEAMSAIARFRPEVAARRG